MSRVVSLWFVLAGIFSTCLCHPTVAQTSWKAEHCQVISLPGPTGPTIVIDEISVDGKTDVPDTLLNPIFAEVRATTFVGTDFIDEVQEVILRGGLQNQGYYKPFVSAQTKVISSSPTLQHVSVSAHVNAGSRYTLSMVQFRNHDSSETHIAFSAEELRPVIPLHDGDIFSVSKVREGLEALFNYYRAHGYIDFVPMPKFKIDEVRQQITLVIALQEGTQYRLGNIEVVGLDPALESQLRSKIRSGDLLNFQLINEFYEEHKSELPAEVLPEDTQFIRHTQERTADAMFDFRSCAQLSRIRTSSPVELIWSEKEMTAGQAASHQLLHQGLD